MQSLSYNPVHVNKYGLGCFRFARRYSGNRKNLLPDYNGATAKHWQVKSKKFESLKVAQSATFNFMNFTNL